jgi:hypothetical protein
MNFVFDSVGISLKSFGVNEAFLGRASSST